MLLLCWWAVQGPLCCLSSVAAAVLRSCNGLHCCWIYIWLLPNTNYSNFFWNTPSSKTLFTYNSLTLWNFISCWLWDRMWYILIFFFYLFGAYKSERNRWFTSYCKISNFQNYRLCNCTYFGIINFWIHFNLVRFCFIICALVGSLFNLYFYHGKRRN